MDETEQKPRNTHPNPEKRQALARALAEGVAPGRAAERAGYRRNHGQRVRERATRPDLAARIVEIRTRTAQNRTESEPLIEQLLDAAGKARLLNSAAGYAAVRGLLAEAARLQSRVEGPVAPAPPRSRLPEMTTQEWLAVYGPKRVITP